MPTPNPVPHDTDSPPLDDTRLHPSESLHGLRWTRLGQLCLAVSASVIVLLVALVLWRLARIMHPDGPAADERVASLRHAASSKTKDERGVKPRREDASRVISSVETEGTLNAERPPPLEPPALPPQPVQAVPPLPLTPDEIVEQRLQKDEEELRRQLRAIPELRLLSDREAQMIRATGNTTPTRAARGQRQRSAYERNRILHNTLKGAALQSGLALRSAPRLNTRTAEDMERLSKELRVMGFVTGPQPPKISLPPPAGAWGVGIRRPATPPAVRASSLLTAEESTIPFLAKNAAGDKHKAFRAWCDRNKVEQFSGALPTLLQMLQIEDVPTRLLLVGELARIKTTSATAALAGRAMMDLSPEVRRAAVAALGARSRAEYIPVLLRGLRYPWPPVADHAAAALRTLKAREAVPELVDLLDQTDPSVPAFDPGTKQYVVRELVRLNHMRNCFLCHAPSADENDGLVRGLVPAPGLLLPQANPAGNGYSGGDGDFVRADTTYLQQDFSIKLLDQDVSPWLVEQRYDFVTRLRTVPPDQDPAATNSLANYPQRDAVLYALRGMTGKDAGDSSAKWRDLLGITEAKPVHAKIETTAAVEKTGAPPKGNDRQP
jgi:HEAT repeat protein